jgi:hypothetical protein
MDVIRFLCVSLGSSIAQLHNSLCSRCACACSEDGCSSQIGDRAWGVYESTTEEQRSVERFCGRKCSMQRMLIKKCFLFTVGSVCRVKRLSLGGKSFADDEEVETEVSETTVKRLLCCGFWRTGKAMAQVYQCWWRICRQINVSSRFEYHMFYVLFPLVTNLLTLPRIRLSVVKVKSCSRFG